MESSSGLDFWPSCSGFSESGFRLQEGSLLLRIRRDGRMVPTVPPHIYIYIYIHIHTRIYIYIYIYSYSFIYLFVCVFVIYT